MIPLIYCYVIIDVKYLAYTIRRAIAEVSKEVTGLKVKQANGKDVYLADLDPSKEEDLWILLNIPANNALELLHQYAAAPSVNGTEVALKNISPYSVQVNTHSLPNSLLLCSTLSCRCLIVLSFFW